MSHLVLCSCHHTIGGLEIHGWGEVASRLVAKTEEATVLTAFLQANPIPAEVDRYGRTKAGMEEV